jgi:hypothetical protein
MFDPTLGPEWKPDVAKFVMNIQNGKVLAVAVDPGYRNSWKIEPYYSAFKKMALALFEQGLMVAISDGVNKILVTPDKDIIVCKHTEAVNFTLRREKTGLLTRWVAEVDETRPPV